MVKSIWCSKQVVFSPWVLFFLFFQYEFDAFGRHFHLLLKHDPAASAATQTLRAHHVFSNHSHVQPVHQDASKCFYSGMVRGDEKSTVNLNLCHGMVSTVYFAEFGSFLARLAQPPWRAIFASVYFRGLNAL